jgi:hypothetical protein
VWTHLIHSIIKLYPPAVEGELTLSRTFTSAPTSVARHGHSHRKGERGGDPTLLTDPPPKLQGSPETSQNIEISTMCIVIELLQSISISRHVPLGFRVGFGFS